MDWLPINWRLIGNPINWAIVVLMVAIAGLAIDVVLNAAEGKSFNFALNLPGLPTQAGATPPQS